MADVAQSIRASVCGTEGRGFDPRRSPHLTKNQNNTFYSVIFLLKKLTELNI
jgi:hypothetical protein